MHNVLVVIATVLILIVTIILLLRNRIRADIVALLAMVALGVTQVLTPEEVFSGFSRAAVITIAAVFVLAQGLFLTGVSERVGGWLARTAGQSESRLVILVMACGAFLSLFMNNIAAASVLLPAVTGVARRQKVNPSRLLMPLAFGTILGGMATLFTTANIVMSGLLREQNLPGFGLIDFIPVGIPCVVVGILYMALWGRRWLPAQSTAERLAADMPAPEGDLTDVYQLNERLFRARIPTGSYLQNRPLSESTFREQYNLNIVALERNGRTILAPPPDTVFHVGDVVTLEGSLEEFRQKDVQPYLEILDPRDFAERDLESTEIIVTEVALSPRSTLLEKTLKEVHFREKFGFTALAIWRANHPIRRGMTTTPLAFGDALLLQGPKDRLRLLQMEPGLIVLGESTESHQAVRTDKLRIALLIMAITLIAAATNVLPTDEAMLLGSLAMILTGCLTADEAYQAIEWKSVFLVAGMLPMGLALTKTGIAAWMANNLVDSLGMWGEWVLLAGMFVLTMLLTQIISGPAVIAMVGPLAIGAAQTLGANPTHFSLGIALAASMAFLTPLGHPVNILVMGPGGYQFADYLKVGFPLSILITAVILIVLPLVMPL